MFDYRLALDRRHTGIFAPFFLVQLVAPIALDKIRAVCS